MRLIRIGRRLSICFEPCDLWIGVFIGTAHVYVCPLPMLVVRWARRNACEYENHRECTGCTCACHQLAHTCVPFDPPERRCSECQRCRDEAAEVEAP